MDSAVSQENSPCGEIFEINDFTVVTELERFVVAIEALIQEWGLSGFRPFRKYGKGCLKNAEWISKSEIVRFGESNKLRVTYYYPDVVEGSYVAKIPTDDDGYLPACAHDMISAETDFVYRSNITSMYGVTEFIVFSPADQVDDAIVTEDQKNLIISAFRMAGHSIECEVPMFIQYETIERQLFFGTICNKAVTTHFEGSHLRKGQSRHQHLSGLLDMFKEHVKCPISLLDAPDIRVSVQFEYIVKVKPKGFLFDHTSGNFIDVTQMPFGSVEHPIDEFKLIAVWPNLKEEMIHENNCHTDLELLNAFNWLASVNFVPVEGILSSTLFRLLSLCSSPVGADTAVSLLGLNNSPGMNAFDHLTDGGIHTLKFGPSSGQSITNPGGILMDQTFLPIKKAVLDRCICDIFNEIYLDDMDEMEYFSQTNLTKPPGYVVRNCEISFNKDFTLNSGKESSLNDKIDCLLRHNKSAPRDSLTMRFVTAVTQTAVENVFGPNAFAQMWLEFVKKLRYHYENNMNLPGMDDVIQPNLSSCLLHQKLEMLQCCISAKKKRHELYDNTKEFGTDEFFDAQSDTEWSDSEEMIGSAATVSIASFSSSRDSSNMEPIGRLHPCGDMRLIRHNEFLMYVPITQDRSPMTEDMAEEYARYLSSLEDGEARIEAQLDTLRSDMQAFKAANPKGCLEDFIRWHSPKDWNVEENCLSERMQIPNNTWIQCWEKALPIPVVNQVRLFNETKIAEEILSMLENASIALMVELLRPVLFTAAAMYLIQQGDSINILLDTASLVQSVYRANRSGNRDDYLEALKQIRLTEKMILYHNSLKEQFKVTQIGNSPIDPPTEEELSLFIISLIQDFQVKREHYERNVISRGVPIFGASNGSLGHAVRKMMEIRDSYGEVKLPLPTRRQYVLRWMVPCPGAKSRPVPQRLFASIEDDEFRLCGSFSEDTIYV